MLQLDRVIPRQPCKRPGGRRDKHQLNIKFYLSFKLERPSSSLSPRFAARCQGPPADSEVRVMITPARPGRQRGRHCPGGAKALTADFIAAADQPAACPAPSPVPRCQRHARRPGGARQRHWQEYHHWSKVAVPSARLPST